MSINHKTSKQQRGLEAAYANQACTIKRLIAELEEAKADVQIYIKTADVELNAKKLAEKEAQRYRKALERIANRDKYGTTGHWFYGDCGKIAREALEGQ